ncbi:manganese ABC transporter, inner membrane permease protein SitC [Ichthyobacterium seriolicida]|uniref:Manganese ABC transporter, inner membrane permease protein SitC n=1 Tax=Ichthyobacterium seriolicida TaxID=242600 RepID=A0A1J1DWJ6_9FLAO|nr:manganese ABC transporter, inner membrane permease protein SitC [Ichthyobacterium seriolicida]
MIQNQSHLSKSGLNNFIFGKAASMSESDIYILASVAVIIIIFVIVFYKAFIITCFNREYAKTIGLPVVWIESLISTLTILAIASGIQTVGVVLISSILIVPCATARYQSDKLYVIIILSAIIGGVSSLFGVYISFVAPSMPTGPWIVISLSIISFLFMLLATKNGVITKMILKRNNQRKILLENILKTLYKLGEDRGDFFRLIQDTHIMSKRHFTQRELHIGMKRLCKKKFVIPSGQNTWKLSKMGLEEGKRVTRIHRLWELYLSVKLRLKKDHLHPIAESIEHVITPEIEAELYRELSNPKSDPHEKIIP